jgi:ribosomal protein S18 acetylase RimI-like enzyme
MTFDEHSQRQPDVFMAEDKTSTGTILDSHFTHATKNASRPLSLVLVCRAGAQLVGYVVVLCSDEARGKTQYDRRGWVFDLSLRPEFRDRGLGSALMRQATQWAVQNGVTVLGGQVWAGNDSSAAMFRKQGYEAIFTSFRKRLQPPINEPMPTSLPRRTGWRNWIAELTVAILFLALLLLGILSER